MLLVIAVKLLTEDPVGARRPSPMSPQNINDETIHADIAIIARRVDDDNEHKHEEQVIVRLGLTNLFLLFPLAIGSVAVSFQCSRTHPVTPAWQRVIHDLSRFYRLYAHLLYETIMVYTSTSTGVSLTSPKQSEASCHVRVITIFLAFVWVPVDMADIRTRLP